MRTKQKQYEAEKLDKNNLFLLSRATIVVLKPETTSKKKQPKVTRSNH